MSYKKRTVKTGYITYVNRYALVRKNLHATHVYISLYLNVTDTKTSYGSHPATAV